MCLSYAADGKICYRLDPLKELSSPLVSRGMLCCVLLAGGRDNLSEEHVMLDATDSVLHSHGANIMGHRKTCIKLIQPTHS